MTRENNPTSESLLRVLAFIMFSLLLFLSVATTYIDGLSYEYFLIGVSSTVALLRMWLENNT